MHGTVRKFIAVGTMAFAASSLMIGTASAAKAPKPKKATVNMTINEHQSFEGTAKLTYTTSSVETVLALKKQALEPSKAYKLWLIVDGTQVEVCAFTSSKSGTGKCPGKKTAIATSVAGTIVTVAVYLAGTDMSNPGIPEAAGTTNVPAL